MKWRLLRLVCLACALGMLSFSFGQQEFVVKSIVIQGAVEKAPAKAGKVEMKKAVPAKAAARKDAKTPVADLLNAALDGLFGNAAPANAPKAVPVPMMAVPARNDNFVKQMEQQYGPRLRQVHKSEMHLMRLICQPTKAQFDKIAASCEPELQAGIKKYAETMAEQRQGRWQHKTPDARKLISDGLVRTVKTCLSAEQATRYEKEISERDAARRRVVVLSLVSTMDKKLLLTGEQRDKLSEILTKNWQDSWSYAQMLVMGGQNFPQMPDDKINPVLTEAQQGIWRKVNKGQIFYGGSELDWFQMTSMDDEVWTGTESGAKK
jgi:hypothetical protein